MGFREQFYDSLREWKFHLISNAHTLRPDKLCDGGGYNGLVSLGKQALPFIWRECINDRNNGEYSDPGDLWAILVKDIVGDNFKIPENISKVREYTLMWLAENMYRMNIKHSSQL